MKDILETIAGLGCMVFGVLAQIGMALLGIYFILWFLGLV